MSDSSRGAYLAGLMLTGRRVVLVGGGVVAARRVAALLDAGADIVVVAPEVTAVIEDLATRGALTWQARPFRSGDLDGAWYVVAATDDPTVNAAVAAAAEGLRIFCVRADQARGGTALTPASGRSGQVQLAVLAGGRPRRAAAVRDQLIEVVSSATGATGATGAEPGTETRPPTRLPGVAIVGGGPGDPELMTVRARRLLATADVVIVDRLAPQLPLAELSPDVLVIDAAKLPRGRAMAQETINELLVHHAGQGRFVVRLKGGDPYLFGRGSEEVSACRAAGIPVQVVPGISSALAVPGLAGIPLTHRGVAHEVVIVSGHLAPENPSSLVDWPSLARLRGTLVILMGVEQLESIAASLVAHGRRSQTPVAVISDGSLPGQAMVIGTLSDISAVAAQVQAPAVIVVGDVVDLQWTAPR